MRRAILLIGMLLAFDATGQNAMVTGNELAKHCRILDQAKANVSSWHACVWYVTAIVDVLAFEPISDFRACIPITNVEGPQLAAIAQKYFREHPEQLRLSAHSLVAKALSDAFPCPERHSGKDAGRAGEVEVGANPTHHFRDEG